MASVFDRRAVSIACVVLTLLTAFLVWHASLVVDGTRYFWLDDDQMVSMRYARNLAQGHGLVWNPGERVEGYTSVGWALVMAGAHLLPVSEAKTALVVKVVAWVLACFVVVLTDRLLRRFVPQPGLARPFTLLTLVLSGDLLFWSNNGFETTLLTALFLTALLRILREGDEQAPRALTYLLIGLLPIARSDAYYFAAGLVVIAFGLQNTWWPLLRRLPLAAIFPVAHLIIRHAYYGDWLPNTYYLKVQGIDDLFGRGRDYLTLFVEAYPTPLILAAAGVWWARDRRRFCIAAGAALAPMYVLTVGADMFPHFRYLAPWIPVLLVLAAAAATQIGGPGSRSETVLLVAMLVTTELWGGVHGRGSLIAMQSGNGNPPHFLIVGLMTERFTRPEATIAVFAAGTAPYFSHRYAIDLLGKSDARIARLPGHRGAPVGHGKFDIDSSLARQPDLVLTWWSSGFTANPAFREFAASDLADSGHMVAMVSARRFVDEYQDNVIPLEYLLRNGVAYVRRGSPEFSARGRWRLPRLGT